MTKQERTNKKISQAICKLTPEAIKRLEEAYEMDCSMDEVAFHARVSTPTLYNWKDRDPELFKRLDQLRQNPVFLARKTAVGRIKESYGNAMDYLKRKKKLEFAEKSAFEDDEGKNTLVPLADAINKLANKK